jgi:hypothetical protein
MDAPAPGELIRILASVSAAVVASDFRGGRTIAVAAVVSVIATRGSALYRPLRWRLRLVTVSAS